MTDWLAQARALGFDTAVPLEPAKLEARVAVRDMCAADKCGAFGKNWMCPPFCGTVEQCQSRLHSYASGILLQTIGTLSKTIDTEGYLRTEQLHMKRFYALAEQMRREYPDGLYLGAGGCRVCKRCAWPEPCLFPEKAVSSMEGYGLFVTQVCRDCAVPYYYGPKTIAYTACILY